MSSTLSLGDMINIVTLAELTDPFKTKCIEVSDDGTPPALNMRKAIDFLKDNGLPTTIEEYHGSTRYAFNIVHPKRLKLNKGDYAILSADGILNTTSFVKDVGTDIIIIKALEDFELDSSVHLYTPGPIRSLVDSLQPYADNYLIEIITNVSALVFSPSKYILQKDGEE